MHLIVKSDRRIERAGYDSHYRCSLLAERNFRQNPNIRRLLRSTFTQL
jgi:hypothetical protein